jgi:hypothetical protein
VDRVSGVATMAARAAPIWRNWMSMLSTTRAILGRPIVPLLVLAAVVLAACNQVGQSANSLGFWDVIWAMIAFFFWFMLIWIFIAIFADIFRRNDLTGGWKAIWIILLVFLPFLGALIYIIARPKVTAQDVQLMTQQDAAINAANSVTAVDQIAKLEQLKASGAITQPEYEELKKKALQG